MTDHDRLFKELIKTFFEGFVRMNLPEIADDIDFDSVVFLDKEVFTDIRSGEKHIADLVVRLKFKGSDVCFLIHVEHQSRPDPDFPERMFEYFARLHETYGLPIYPIVIFSHATPRRIEPCTYELVVFGESVLKFQYKSIQLNQMSWKAFLDHPNPIATALMTRMNIAMKDRPKAKVELLRMLATFKLDPAKSELIGVFIDTYLKLNAAEMQVYEREIAALLPEQREATMEMITSWHKEGREVGRQEGLQEGLQKGLQKGLHEGIQEGLQKGKEQLLALQMQRRFSTLPDGITKRLDTLSPDQMDELGLALFDFTSLAELETWLSSR